MARVRLRASLIRKLIFFPISGVILIILICNSFRVVRPSYRGVRVTLGKVSDKVLQPGFYFKWPFFQKIKKYNISPQEMDITFSIGEDSAITKDMQSIGLTTIVLYKYDENALIDLIENYSGSSLNNAIRAALKATNKEVIGKYDAYGIVENQSSVRDEMEATLKNKIHHLPIIITQLSISNIDWSKQFDEQIAETMRRTQEVKQAQQELLIVEQQSQKQVKEAEAQKQATELTAEAALIKAQKEAEANLIRTQKEAEATLIKAQKESEAIKVMADADAYKNEQLSKNFEIQSRLRELDIEELKYQKWDGHYVSEVGIMPVAELGNVSIKK